MMGAPLQKTLHVRRPWNNLNVRTPIVGLLFLGVFLAWIPSASAGLGLGYADPLTITKATAKDLIHHTRYEVGRVFSCRPIAPTHVRCRTEALARLQFFDPSGKKIAEETYYVPAIADVGWRGVHWTWDTR